MREYGYAEVTGGGRNAGFQLPQRPEIPEDKREQVENYAALRRYATLEDLAQAVHDGQANADDDARSLLEKVRRIYARKRLTVLPGDEEWPVHSFGDSFAESFASVRGPAYRRCRTNGRTILLASRARPLKPLSVTKGTPDDRP